MHSGPELASRGCCVVTALSGAGLLVNGSASVLEDPALCTSVERARVKTEYVGRPPREGQHISEEEVEETWAGEWGTG
jgi:hypothetical protein